MNWSYLGCEVTREPSPEELFGFIYLVTFTDGTKYVGKKQIWMKHRLKPRKTDRKNAKRIVYRESKWHDYEGSSQHRGDRDVLSKEILRFCFSKKELTYYEERELFVRDVLTDEQYLNANIRGVYFKKDLV